MDYITFIIFVLTVAVVAWVAVWLLGNMLPGHPVIIDRIIWAVAVFLILWTLARATGLLSHSPQIPRV